MRQTVLSFPLTVIEYHQSIAPRNAFHSWGAKKQEVFGDLAPWQPVPHVPYSLSFPLTVIKNHKSIAYRTNYHCQGLGQQEIFGDLVPEGYQYHRCQAKWDLLRPDSKTPSAIFNISNITPGPFWSTRPELMGTPISQRAISRVRRHDTGELCGLVTSHFCIKDARANISKKNHQGPGCWDEDIVGYCHLGSLRLSSSVSEIYCHVNIG